MLVKKLCYEYVADVMLGIINGRKITDSGWCLVQPKAIPYISAFIAVHLTKIKPGIAWHVAKKLMSDLLTVLS